MNNNDEEEMTSSHRCSSSDEDTEEEEDEENDELNKNEGKTITNSSADNQEKRQIVLIEEENAPQQPKGFGAIANGEENEFLTKVDNPIYPLFIRSVMGAEDELDPVTREQLYNGLGNIKMN